MNLSIRYEINKDGDGEGEELPASVNYFAKGSTDFTVMTVTHSSLCRRKLEKRICKAFIDFIKKGSTLRLGTEVSDTRIGGAGYGTMFLATVGSIAFDNVDTSRAFLGVDSQDPPLGSVVLYVYAKKGDNLIQLSTPVGECQGFPSDGQSDNSYYKDNCLTEKILGQAKAKADQLFPLFKILP